MGTHTQAAEAADTSFHGRRHRQRMADPEFEAEYARSQRVIAGIDAVMQRLDALRAQEGLTKAQLARRIGKDPATLRCLFSSQVNPTLETVVALADALGALVKVVPAHPAQGSPKGGNQGG